MTEGRGAIAVALAACASGCGPPVPASDPHALLDQPMPEILATSVDGVNIDTRLSANQPVVVKFFAEYCSVCMKTLPEVQRFASARSDVMVVGVSEDVDLGAVRRVISSRGLKFPVIWDQRAEIAGQFGLRSLPATFVTDRSHMVRWVGGGREVSPLEIVVDGVGRAALWECGKL